MIIIQEESIEKGISIIENHHLHNKASISGLLYIIHDYPDRIRNIYIAYSLTPVGCCVVLQPTAIGSHVYNVMVYVKKKHRRKGIGTLLLYKVNEKELLVDESSYRKKFFKQRVTY